MTTIEWNKSLDKDTLPTRRESKSTWRAPKPDRELLHEAIYGRSVFGDEPGFGRERLESMAADPEGELRDGLRGLAARLWGGSKEAVFEAPLVLEEQAALASVFPWGSRRWLAELTRVWVEVEGPAFALRAAYLAGGILAANHGQTTGLKKGALGELDWQLFREIAGALPDELYEDMLAVARGSQLGTTFLHQRVAAVFPEANLVDGIFDTLRAQKQVHPKLILHELALTTGRLDDLRWAIETMHPSRADGVLGWSPTLVARFAEQSAEPIHAVLRKAEKNHVLGIKALAMIRTPEAKALLESLSTFPPTKRAAKDVLKKW